MKLKLVETNSVDLGQNQPNDSAFSRRGLMGGLVALALAIGGAAVIQHLNLSNWLGQIVCLALGSIVIECAVNNPLERVQERLWWTVLSVRALVVGCSGCVIVGATFVVGELVLDPRAMVFFEGLTRLMETPWGLSLLGVSLRLASRQSFTSNYSGRLLETNWRRWIDCFRWDYGACWVGWF